MTDLYNLTARLRVRNGVSVLDKHVPGWQTRINPETFEINNMSGCILGQLWGWYTDGLEALVSEMTFAEREAWAREHGFNSGEGVGSIELDDMWKNYLGFYTYDGTPAAPRTSRDPWDTYDDPYYGADDPYEYDDEPPF